MIDLRRVERFRVVHWAERDSSAKPPLNPQTWDVSHSCGTSGRYAFFRVSVFRAESRVAPSISASGERAAPRPAPVGGPQLAAPRTQAAAPEASDESASSGPPGAFTRRASRVTSGAAGRVGVRVCRAPVAVPRYPMSSSVKRVRSRRDVSRQSSALPPGRISRVGN